MTKLLTKNLSEITVGILGGGQLARMTVEAAQAWGLQVAILENAKNSSAGQIAAFEFVGHWSDATVLQAFAEVCDVITLENEFVDAGILAQLEAMGKPVFPSSATLALVQDKARQKQTLQAAGLPIPAFVPVNNEQEVQAFAETFGWPLIVKARRNGYDGRGNYKLDRASDINLSFEKLGYPERELMVEAFVPFVKELAVMVVRGQDSQTKLYPVVETVQQNHICHNVTAPAEILPQVAQQAQQIAQRAIEAINGVGVFGVELFLTADNLILINELAPRPHNSGHYTIEACQTSQFENLLRVVLGMPIGSTAQVAPAAMVNLLGQIDAPSSPSGIPQALGVPGVNLHLYSKGESRPGRKMGHLTVLAPNADSTPADALALAEEAASFVKL